MWGGYAGPGHKTIIPAEAHAKVTFRLVSDQRPEDVGPQLRAWVEANVPDGITAEVHTPPGGVVEVRGREEHGVVTIEVAYLTQINAKLREFIQLWSAPRIIAFASSGAFASRRSKAASSSRTTSTSVTASSVAERG